MITLPAVIPNIVNTRMSICRIVLVFSNTGTMLIARTNIQNLVPNTIHLFYRKEDTEAERQITQEKQQIRTSSRYFI